MLLCENLRKYTFCQDLFIHSFPLRWWCLYQRSYKSTIFGLILSISWTTTSIFLSPSLSPLRSQIETPVWAYGDVSAEAEYLTCNSVCVLVLAYLCPILYWVSCIYDREWCWELAHCSNCRRQLSWHRISEYDRTLDSSKVSPPQGWTLSKVRYSWIMILMTEKVSQV